jgi:hypothetical protein
MLQECVRIKYPDGKIGSFLEVKDQDRLYLIFLIRELTFQQGNSLTVNTKCTCGLDNTLELNRKNFSFHVINDKLEQYFNSSSKSYSFETKNGNKFDVTPPNIGLQKAFTDYIIKENAFCKPIFGGVTSNLLPPNINGIIFKNDKFGETLLLFSLII